MKKSVSLQKSYIKRDESSKKVHLVYIRSFFVTIIFVLICSIGFSQNFKIVQSGPSVSNPGETITYIIAVNNTGVTVSDAVIKAHLSSSGLYTYISSKPTGEYNAEKNTIKWDKTNNPELTSFANGEIYLTVTIRVGANVSGEYKVPDVLSKLKLFTTLESNQLNLLINGNEIITDIPKAGGAVLPVE